VPKDQPPHELTRFELREYLGEEDWDSPDGEHLVLHGRHPKYPDWAVKAIFEVGRDDVTLSHLTIYPAAEWAPPGGLTDEVRRTVRLDDLRRRARLRLTRRDVAGTVGVDPEKFTRNKARGRKGRTDLDYAQLAQRYVERLDQGDRVAGTLAKEERLSESTIRALIWEARQRGLLTRSSPGHAGGHLTDKARRLLDSAG